MASDPNSTSELALNRQLEAEPHSLLLNIQKADFRAQAGDDDVACYFYRRALQLAADLPLPQAEAAEARRAELALASAAGRAYARREKRLTERGLAPRQWSPRLRASLELSADRRHCIQDPTHHHYPGLPEIEFYDPGQFAWAPAVEAATAAIRDELIALLAKGTDEFSPFTPNDVGLPMGVSKALLDKRDWSVMSLCEQGWLKPDHVERCPITWQTLLRHAPVPRVAGWGPSAVFSLLKAGAHIGAHTGMYNSRLICHLPLIVPPGCRFRVGNEVREWEVGKLLIFDDTIEHEAWNDGEEDRVVLIFDIWRPELTEEEKRELTLLFSD
ncbi:MAG TPA: aspartyl/asparaginyl beta-hydroxylase domain-containing protein [Allosphingosinicella sp.]|jgi:aspartyl/asparaginyl beta-hydroxylase (cupin superfamily)|nr:aspartyl/asparaginyl beta-hydroxylase domain-containing protein [Allosphingosinicella sp.]